MEDIMSTLKKDIPRVYVSRDIDELPVAANTLIPAGTMIGDNGFGYMRPLVRGDEFKGFAEERVDNTQGGDGDRTVRFRMRGSIVLEIKGVTWEDAGSEVYAVDDNTFTLIPTRGSYMGRIASLNKAGQAEVEFAGYRKV
jgi:hypothetical protein